jgi:hypothetical protein
MRRKVRATVTLVRREAVLSARAAHEGSLDRPSRGSRVRRFFFGLTLPLGVTRAALADAPTSHLWRDVALAQLGALGTFALSAALFELKGLLEDGLSWGAAAEALAGWYGAVCVAEWIIIALSREYHDAISVRAAQVTGIAVAPLFRAPRVRLDMGWLWLKAKRAMRLILLVAVGLPPLAVFALVPRVGHYVYAGLTLAWTAYWAAAFAIANAPECWEHPAPGEPWFLRGLRRAAAVPVVGWLVAPYAWLVARVCRSVVWACRAFEEVPFEASGLALARAIASVPGLYLFARPVFPVAASHALGAPLLALSRRVQAAVVDMGLPS